MQIVLRGEASTPQLTALLAALRVRGESAEELTGFARAMREAAHRVDAGDGMLIDTCGTGGDATGTLNVSTIAAFVIAGADVRVAKHGNRSVTSRFGSADLMEALGVPLAMTPAESGAAIRDVGIGFLFAPLIHPAMKHAAPARAELKMRTVFNLLGPLTNPAGAQAQLVGAPSARAAELIAQALAKLGLSRGLVVHGMDGMDEITTTGPTLMWEVGGAHRQITPEEFGVARATLDQLRPSDPVAAARGVLQGQYGPMRDIVLVNAAAGLVTSGAAADWLDGMHQAQASINSGAAWAKVEQLSARRAA
jgi:anthranilate phosphoribosyltransferase